MLAASTVAWGKSLALLVGVGTYDNPQISNLRCLEADIALMRRTLVEQLGTRPEDILVLTNQQATASAVAEAFQRHLIRQAGPKDRVIFYFTGHGSQVQDHNGDEADGQDEVLVTYGAKWQDSASFITDDHLRGWLESSRCAQAITILDCCHAGTGTRSANGPLIKACDLGYDATQKGAFAYLPRQNGFQRLNTNEGTFKTLIAACSAEEKALGPATGSLLTSALCQQLRSAGFQPLSEIMKRTTARVQAEAKRLEHEQTPQLEGATQIVLTADATNPTSPPISPATDPGLPRPTAPPTAIAPVRPLPTDGRAMDGAQTRELLPDETVQRQDFAVSLKVLNADTGQSVSGREVRPGTRLMVQVVSGKPAHLRLYHWDAAGHSTMLLPNQYQTNLMIEANQQVLVPSKAAKFDFVVTDSPTGVENLKAVCASIPFEEELTPPGKGSPFFGQAPLRPFESVSRGLAVVGRTKPEANLEIAEAVVSYRVVK